MAAPPQVPPDNPIGQPTVYRPLPEEMLGDTFKNIKQDVITITADRATIYLQAWCQKLENRSEWLGPFSLLCTLVLTFLTTEFKDRWFLKSQQWSTVFLVGTALSFIWTAKILYNRLFVRVETVEQIIEKFKNLPPPPPKLNIWQRFKVARGYKLDPAE